MKLNLMVNMALLPAALLSTSVLLANSGEEFDPRDSVSSTGQTWTYSDFGFDDQEDVDPGYAPLNATEDNYWEFDRIDLNGERIKDTTKFPASAIVYIKSKKAFGGKSTRCSGFIIGTKSVATAGHCIYRHLDNGKSGWNNDIHVYPGRDDSKKPFGSCKAINKIAPKGWTEKGKDEYDYGMLVLNCDIAKKTGRLGYSNSYSLKDKKVKLNTYSSGNGKQQWRYSSKIEKVEDKVIRYDYKGSGHGGSSGSAVYIPGKEDCGVCAVGIHGGGFSGKRLEIGVRINKSVFNNFRQWKKDDGDEG